MRNRNGRLFRGMRVAAGAVLALGACRDRTPQQQGAPPAAPAAAARVDVTMRLPDQPPWNDSDTLTVTIQNASTAALPDAVLDLFVAAPVAAPVDSSTAIHPEATVNVSGTRLRFAIGPVAVGQTIEVKQAIHTPPAPAPPAAPPAPGQPPAQPTSRTPAARTDTAARFVIRASLLKPDGTPLAAPVEDTLRIRPESAVTVGGCGNVTDVVGSRYGVGPVRVGMPVDALRSACPEARDTTWKGPEGTAETGLIAMPGGRRVIAVMAGGTVQRVVIDQPGLKTPAGAGVGAQVGDLRSRFGRMCAGAGEGRVAVWFPNAPGISFGLDTVATKGWTPARIDPDSVPDTVAVGSMWIRRGSDDCPAGPGESTR
jgi:hypothetical protein